MATIRKEFTSPRSAAEVWAKLRDFSAVHELAKGFVVATKMQDDRVRVVTFANGMEIQERLVSSDDAQRRLVYAITESPMFQHYSASAQVLEEGSGARFVWTVDFLPDEAAAAQDAVMEIGAEAMAAALA